MFWPLQSACLMRWHFMVCCLCSIFKSSSLLRRIHHQSGKLDFMTCLRGCFGNTAVLDVSVKNIFTKQLFVVSLLHSVLEM